VFQAANGYHLKNTPSNGALFQIAARLARYTHDEMYAQWAVKIWDWMWAVGLVDNVNYMVYDNTDTNNNCTTLDRQMWTYNGGTMLAGCAIMFNYVSAALLASTAQKVKKAHSW
jgi:mannan endo-1,6-alpha-mannosidase